MTKLTIRPYPASMLYKSIAGRYRPVSYPDGPITARYRFIKNAYWVVTSKDSDQPVHPHSTAMVLVYLALDTLEAVEVEGICDQRRL